MEVSSGPQYGFWIFFSQANTAVAELGNLVQILLGCNSHHPNSADWGTADWGTGVQEHLEDLIPLLKCHI